MSRNTRANSIDERLYTATDHDNFIKRSKKHNAIPEEDTFHTPNQTDSPTTLFTQETNKRDLSSEFDEISIEMSTISYADIKDLIPKFDGEKKSLDEFIQIVDSLASQLTEEKDKKLFNLSVRSHLTNRAFNSIRHLQVATWAQIRQSLKDKLNPLDATTCYNALTHAKQTQNESITDFAMKVETLLTNLNRSSTIDANEETRKFVQTNNEKLAKRAFENGIMNFQLKTLIIAKNKNTLESAIKEALDLDSSGDYSNKEKKLSKICKFCKKKGHSEEDCYKKKSKSAENTADGEDKPDKVCTFCKRKGHTVQECRTKARSKGNGHKSHDAKAHVVATEDTDNEDETVTLEDLESSNLN